MGHTYLSLVVLSIFFGAVISSVPTVSTPLIVDLIGINNLNTAFGMFSSSRIYYCFLLQEYSLLPEDLQQLLGLQLQDLSWTMFPLTTVFLSTLLPSSLVLLPFYMASYGASIANNQLDLDTPHYDN